MTTVGFNRWRLHLLLNKKTRRYFQSDKSRFVSVSLFNNEVSFDKNLFLRVFRRTSLSQWINSTWCKVLNVNPSHCGSSKLDKDINMDTCGPSCCHDHQQQQQQQHPLYRFRHRLPSGNQRFLNKLALRKPLRTEPFNYINLKQNDRLAIWRVITSVHHLHPPPPPPVPLHHQFGTFISGCSFPGETEKCQDKGDMAYPPCLAFSFPVLSLPPFF